MPTPTRTDRIDLRISPEAKQALQAAALAKRTSVSDFVLASAMEAAQEALADRQRFGLNADQWAAFKRPSMRRFRLTPDSNNFCRSLGYSSE